MTEKQIVNNHDALFLLPLNQINVLRVFVVDVNHVLNKNFFKNCSPFFKTICYDQCQLLALGWRLNAAHALTFFRFFKLFPYPQVHSALVFGQGVVETWSFSNLILMMIRKFL